MAESIPKLHHHTACSYLQYFSPEGEKKRMSRIYRGDKEEKEIKFLPAGVIGAENDYYTIIKNGKKDTFIENPLLSKIDGQYSLLINKFETQVPIESFKEAIRLYFASQFVRVPTQREEFIRIIEDDNVQRRRIGVSEDKLGSVDNNILNIDMLMEMELVHAILKDFYFHVLISDKDEFITCDNPAGESSYPLSSSMCLVMSSGAIQQDYIVADSSCVDIINQITFKKAKRWVYAKSKDTLLKFMV